MAEREALAESIKETSRIESFSDGVFAIAITLLILDLHVPDFKPNQSLVSSLAAEWASMLALLIGFFTILVCWINHHYMFQLIYRSNSMLLFINGFKLLIVTITPFSTALLAKHIQTGWAREAVSIYCLNFAFMGISMACIWCYANRKGFARASSTKILDVTTWLYIFAGTFSTFILVVSFFSITGCLVLSAIMFCVFIFPKNTVEWFAARDKQQKISV